MEIQKKESEPDAAELVSSLMAVAPSAAFVFVRIGPDGEKKEYPCRIQLPRQEENLQLLQLAQETAKRYGEIDAKYGDIYREAQAAEIAARVFRKDKLHERPDGTKYYPQVFVDGAQIRQSFTENEISLILNALEVTKAKFRCLEDFDPDELDRWAGRLSDTLLGPLWLQRLDSSHWPALLVGLALEVRALREEVSRPLSSLQPSSESDQASSDTGTGGSTSSPKESLNDSDGNPIHSEHLLTRQEALAIAKKKREKK